MARRMTEDSADTLMSFRISQKMKVIVDKCADSEGVSSAEWIREAIQMRIEREEKSGDDGYYYPDGSRAITDEMLEEKLIKIAEKLKAQGKL